MYIYTYISIEKINLCFIIKSLLNKISTKMEDKPYKYISWFIITNFFAILNIVIIKYLYLDGFNYFHVFFIKGLFTGAMVFAVIKYKSISLKGIVKKYGLVAPVWVLTTFLWYFSLQYIPLNEGLNLRFASPIFSYVFSLYILKEKENVKNNIVILLLNILFISYAIITNTALNKTTIFYYCIVFISCITAGLRYVLFKKINDKDKDLLNILAYSTVEVISCAPFVKFDKIVSIVCNYKTYLMILSYAVYMFTLNISYKIKNITALQPFYFTRSLFGYIACYFILGETINTYYVIIAILASNVLFVIKQYENSLTKQIEIEQKLREQLEKTSKEQEKLFVRIIHDLKTPISIIKMSNNILKERIDNNPSIKISEDASKFFKFISDNSQKLENNINNILKLKQMDSIKDMDTTPEDVNIETLINNCVEYIDILAKQRNINIDVQNTGTMSIFNIDKTRFQIVINNLLSNAIKFAKSNIAIQFSINKNILTFSIKNDGDIISDTLKNDVANNNNNTVILFSENSTGCGLKIISNLVNTLGGTFNINNNDCTEFVIQIKNK